VKEKRIFEGIKKKKVNPKQKLKPLDKSKLPSPPSPRAVGKIYLDSNGRYNKKHYERSLSPKSSNI
jgi:hypothetical protein